MAALSMTESTQAPPEMPALSSAVRYWFRMGCISFGGPAGQIAIMHRELVESRRWIGETHFMHALNFCTLLPGPEAQQLATYFGWRLHGWRGGLAAGALFVLPSAVLLFALSWLYMVHGNIPWIAGVLYGLMPAVIAIVAEAVLRIGKKALKSLALGAIASVSFISIYFLQVSFVLIILSAGLLGWAGSRLASSQFPPGKNHGSKGAVADVCLVLPPAPRATWGRSFRVAGLCLALWWMPILALGAFLGWDSRPFALGTFFSQAALVTFGGAYAVLPYVAHHAVGLGWLSSRDMMSGLALAETTPGPLIMVLQFVGFVAAWNAVPPGASPLAWASAGAVMTTWATFLPCFLFVFLGAPHVEKLRDQPRLGAALTTVTAAVVGVILNLGVLFAKHALWPEGGGFDLFVAVVGVAAFVALKCFRVGLIPVIFSCAVLGLLWKMAVR